MSGPIKIAIFSMVLLLTINTLSLAQDRRAHYEQIEVIKVAFITKKLDLTSEEAQKFWPIYNYNQKELLALMKNRREFRQNVDKTANEKINYDLSYESDLLELKKKYKKLYLKVIPAEKVLLLYQSEREFREHLIKQLKQRKID